ncbi:MAG: hypothetical protein LLF28_00280 [Nitrospiraceae bacterium]|nr:hypothetical protein [Nitrospiraceae bacterium]
MRKVSGFPSRKIFNKHVTDGKDYFGFSPQYIKYLNEFYEKRRQENRQQKVYGYKNLCKIFSIQSNPRKAERSKTTISEANRIAFIRKMKRYGFFDDYIREDLMRNRSYMLKKDINKIKRNCILGISEIAKYFGMNKKYPKKILSRLKKEFPMMPVNLSKQIAYKEKLAEWEFFHFFYKSQKRRLASSLPLCKSLDLFFNFDLRIRSIIEKSPIVGDITKQHEKFRKKFMVLFKNKPTNSILEELRNYLKNSCDFSPPKM